jgi:two-component system phosphate regulon sensor histidine kinase PhoR
LTGKIFFKLIAAVLCLLVVALVAVDFFASKVAESTYLETLERELVDKGRMLALVVPSDRAQFTRYAQAARGRLTLIARDGRVLADSEAPAERMENHANRNAPSPTGTAT